MTRFNKEFFNHFPLLFPTQIHFECMDGWYDLLFDLCSKLENILKNENVHINVDQVKEKFGGLRFYISMNMDDDKFSDIINSVIKEYEAKSYQTCEFCGKEPASQKGKGWIHTICQNCSDVKDIIE